MGEPLQNYAAVVPALKVMLDDHGYGLSRRRVTVSTSGMVPMIDRLRQDCPVALACRCTRPTTRCATSWCRSTARTASRSCWRRAALPAAPRDFVTFEYCMLDGVNDSDAQARALVRLREGARALQVQPDPVQPSGLGPEALAARARASPSPSAAGRRHRDRRSARRVATTSTPPAASSPASGTAPARRRQRPARCQPIAVTAPSAGRLRALMLTRPPCWAPVDCATTTRRRAGPRALDAPAQGDCRGEAAPTAPDPPGADRRSLAYFWPATLHGASGRSCEAQRWPSPTRAQPAG